MRCDDGDESPASTMQPLDEVAGNDEEDEGAPGDSPPPLFDAPSAFPPGVFALPDEDENSDGASSMQQLSPVTMVSRVGCC